MGVANLLGQFSPQSPVVRLAEHRSNLVEPGRAGDSHCRQEGEVGSHPDRHYRHSPLSLEHDNAFSVSQKGAMSKLCLP